MKSGGLPAWWTAAGREPDRVLKGLDCITPRFSVRECPATHSPEFSMRRRRSCSTNIHSRSVSGRPGSTSGKTRCAWWRTILRVMPGVFGRGCRGGQDRGIFMEQWVGESWIAPGRVQRPRGAAAEMRAMGLDACGGGGAGFTKITKSGYSRTTPRNIGPVPSAASVKRLERWGISLPPPPKARRAA